MPLAAPTNCWPFLLQTFADALANSATFQSLVAAVDATGAADRIFGKRLTYTRAGRRWTYAELQALAAYGQVYGHPDNPIGKHRGRGRQFLPHGTTCLVLARLVDIGEAPDDLTGPTDADDREWQNIVGSVLDEVLAWLDENIGAEITSADITVDDETAAKNKNSRGIWQGVELTFNWREEG
jgi:hypothetical protein